MIIGLTGGIGSGKSLVTDILRELGAYIIDADEISRNLTREGQSLNEKIKKTFPECVKDGILNRKDLRNQILKDEKKRNLLNSITHFEIFASIRESIKPNKINIVSVPLLFETKFDKFCDYILGVYSEKQTRIERIKMRDNIDESKAEKIISLQINQEELIKKCDYIIYNDSHKEDLKKKVCSWWEEIIGK